MAAIHLATTATSDTGFPTLAVLGAIVLWGGAWIIGDQISQRRKRHAELVERAERAERETARERRLAVAEERTRIARDLHDSVAHAINVILVQAGSARLLQERDPHIVKRALETIEDVARETIDDIDRLVRTLREGDRDSNGDGTTERDVEPPAGLAAAETLADRHRAAGLAVQITTEGPLRRLAPVLDQAAYRIVQESLTNAARHGSGPARVSIRYGDRSLELVTSNPVAPHRPERTDGGHGLQGMRERATLLGGSLHAGHRAASFTVHATLPYPPQAR
jgi:signal transduction histidine kinase